MESGARGRGAPRGQRGPQSKPHKHKLNAKAAANVPQLSTMFARQLQAQASNTGK
jgi:hypothetical protein